MKIQYVFLIMLLSSCHNAIESNSLIKDSYSLRYSKEQLYRKLDTISTVNASAEKMNILTAFLKEWHVTVPPNSDSFINQNDTIKAVYSVFNSIFNTDSLFKLGDWEIKNTNKMKFQYVVLPNKIIYSVSNKDSINLNTTFRVGKNITDFRPYLTNIDTSKILYLLPEYHYAIENFLGIDTQSAQRNFNTDPMPSNGPMFERAALFKPYIQIAHAHTLGFWILETFPIIEHIMFNKNLTQAKVTYRVRYEGGQALLSKSGNSWVIKKAETTLIE